LPAPIPAPRLLLPFFFPCSLNRSFVGRVNPDPISPTLPPSAWHFDLRHVTLFKLPKREGVRSNRKRTLPWKKLILLSHKQTKPTPKPHDPLLRQENSDLHFFFFDPNLFVNIRFSLTPQVLAFLGRLQTKTSLTPCLHFPRSDFLLLMEVSSLSPLTPFRRLSPLAIALCFPPDSERLFILSKCSDAIREGINNTPPQTANKIMYLSWLVRVVPSERCLLLLRLFPLLCCF